MGSSTSSSRGFFRARLDRDTLAFVQVEHVEIKNVLTRATGYLENVSSHSLQPYSGCTLGLSLCGVGCYVRHSHWVTRGREWGTFLEARTNAAESYRSNYERERRWARKHRSRFSIFLSSSTEPFLPQEEKLGVTRGVLEAMLELPPDVLILQTHSHRVADYVELLASLGAETELRAHISIETDREVIDGLPSHASSVEKRFEAAKTLRDAGITVVVCVSPILPVENPDAFFARGAETADAVVLDHFIGGDGTRDGRRTLKTKLPRAMARIDPASVEGDYRDDLRVVAERWLPGRVGVSADGVAGRFGRPHANSRP